MSTIDLGKIKLVWRGPYDNSTAYTPDDVVSSGGASYICIANSTGNAVSSGSHWNLLAQGGTDISTTLTTQGDLLYRDGSGLQRLAAGTSGQVLQTGGSGANPSWTTVSGGAFGQFVFNSDSTQYSNTNQTNYVRATNTKVQITPSSSSKEILVHFVVNFNLSADDSNFQYKIIRDIGGTETAIESSTNNYMYNYSNDHGTINMYRNASIIVKDNPSTTSQCTYTIEFRNPHRTDAIYLNKNNHSTIMAYEIN